MVFEQLLQQVAAARARAQQAAAAAAADRASRREQNDLWVTGGVNWNGYGLESLIKMVAERAHPGQLEALAGEWSRHGSAVSRASDDLQRALTKLMQFWSGRASDEAVRKVTTNARWIGELGTTAQEMYNPIMDAAGALRSAQDTMPGMPKNNWLSTAGGGAAAGFAVAGPIGAAFGAALGGIASAFGFGNKKKKMKRKAVQTMQRYEGALLGIDQVTPQFPSPSDGVNPGDPTTPTPEGPPIGRPGAPPSPPGGGVVNPTPGPNDGNYGTDPSFAFGPEGRWQSLTGLTPGGGPNVPGLGGGGLGTGLFPGMPGGMAGRGMPGGMGGPIGRGAGAGAGGRGAGGRGAGGRGGAGMPGGMGGAGGRGDRDYRGRGRFSKTGALGPGGAPAGRRGEEEEDGQHRRSVPLEEDLFSSDLKAAPPVIGL